MADQFGKARSTPDVDPAPEPVTADPSATAAGDEDRRRVPAPRSSGMRPGFRPPEDRGRRRPGGRFRPRNWRLRNWRIRTRLLVVLLIPLMLAVVLVGLRVSDALNRADELRTYTGQVAFAGQVGSAAHALQRERTEVAAAVAAGDPTALDDRFRRVDAALTVVRSEGPGGLELSPEAAAVYANTRDQLAALAPTREAVTGSELPSEAALITYTSLVRALLELQGEVLSGAGPELRPQAGAAMAVGAAVEQVSRQHAVLGAALREGELSAVQLASLLAVDAQLTASRTEFASTAGPRRRAAYDAVLSSPAAQTRAALLDAAMRSATAGAAPTADVAQWDAVAAETSARLRAIEEDALSALRADAAALGAYAARAALRDSVAVAVLAALALGMLVLVGRSLLRPLRQLRTAAFDVADRRLPETVQRMRADGVTVDLTVDPMPVHFRGEVGQVARAFDAVHGEAVRLAAQQALLRTTVNDLLVALSRRSESLVEQQLQLIGQLEDGAREPAQLAALFQLDHLSTRMRRTSANLLVLAGEEQANRPVGPVPLIDMLRSAAAEVEGYRRVAVRRPPHVAVHAGVVRDLTHLVAELLDNATACSAPGSMVQLDAERTGHGTVVLEILDAGPGMAHEDLRRANRLLAGPPPEDIAGTPGTGLFVAGRLALRHGISARLRARRPERGTAAILEIPAACLVPLSAPADPPEPVWTAPEPIVEPRAEVTTEQQWADLFGEPMNTSAAPGRRPAAPPAGAAPRRWFGAPDTDTAAGPAWASVAEEGWRAAGALQDPPAAGYTATGLPRRQPRARLVPGSAGPAPGSAPGRSAEEVRNRLDSYRHGLAHGRHALREPDDEERG